jgi:hypothetical protein
LRHTSGLVCSKRGMLHRGVLWPIALVALLLPRDGDLRRSPARWEFA